MSLIVARPKREIPPEGVHQASVSKIQAIDEGNYDPAFRFVFELKDVCQEDGSPHLVFRSCNRKLTPQAALTGVVEGILGRALTAAEAEGGFDLETLVGYLVKVVVKHRESKTGNTYATIESVVHLEGPKPTFRSE